MKFTLFLSCLTAIAFPVVTGCGLSPSQVNSTSDVHPNFHRPFKSLSTSPVVECVGDEICAGLAAEANGPNSVMWRCDDCSQGATSGVVLAGLPLALAQHPDVVVLLTGSYDVDDPEWTGACNMESPDINKHTCTNIEAIVSQLEAAKIPFILGSPPSWQDGTLSDQLAGTLGVDIVDANIFDFERDEDFLVSVDPPGGTLDPGAQFVDYYSAMYSNYIGPNGIDPNPDGYQLMLSMTLPLIQSLHAGGNK